MEFSRQEYWSILVNTGCHTLLERYISCFPSCQLPWVPGAARTPATQAVAPPPHLALTGASPSPPGQPQEQPPVDNPHAEVKVKPQLKTTGSVAKEEDPKPSHQLYKLQIKSTWWIRQILCLWNIEKDIESYHKRKCTSSYNYGHWRQEHRSRSILESELRIWAAPTAGSEISTVLEGILGRWGGLWLPVRGKDSDSSDSRKTFITLMFWLVL